MRYYPVNLDLQGRRVVVIGGGNVGLRKIEGLIEAGAKVRVVDPRPLPEIRRLARKKKIILTQREYKKGDLGRAFAAIASTDDRSINLAIQREAKEKNILLNIVDKPEFCSFVFPAKVNRGEFLITVSTGGSSPALAKKIREELELKFGPEYGLLTKLLSSLRKRIPQGAEAGRIFNRFVRSPVLTRIKQNDWAGVDRLLQKHFGNGTTARSLGFGRKS